MAEEKSVESIGAVAEDEDSAKSIMTTANHDQEGEGEEEEDTIHQVRSKVYKLVKGGGEAKWVDMGIG